MKKIRQILIKVPVILIGVIFLILSFAKIADLSTFHNELLNIKFLPYALIGLGLVFIPGLQLTLGLIFLSPFCSYKNLLKPAAIIAFLSILVTFTFNIYAALTVTKGCGGCGQLEETILNWEAWKPVGIYFIMVIISMIVLFIANNNSNRSTQP